MALPENKDTINCFHCLMQFIPRSRCVHIQGDLYNYYFCSRECGIKYFEKTIAGFRLKIMTQENMIHKLKEDKRYDSILDDKEN